MPEQKKSIANQKEREKRAESFLKNYRIKMRVKDYLERIVEARRVTYWECPLCRQSWGTKTQALDCLKKCKEEIMRQSNEELG